MPKIRTCKTAAKRFEVTANGKIRHGHSGMNHLMMKKTKAGQRKLTVKSTVTGGQMRVIKRQIPGI